MIPNDRLVRAVMTAVVVLVILGLVFSAVALPR
jgi:Flp pilus assembly protein TadG